MHRRLVLQFHLKKLEFCKLALASLHKTDVNGHFIGAVTCSKMCGCQLYTPHMLTDEHIHSGMCSCLHISRASLLSNGIRLALQTG